MYCTVRPTREDSLARHRRGSTSVFLRQVRITSMGAKGWLRSGRKRMTQRGMRIPWVWPSKTRMEPGADEAAASPALNSLMVGERGAAAAAAVAAAAASHWTFVAAEAPRRCCRPLPWLPTLPSQLWRPRVARRGLCWAEAADAAASVEQAAAVAAATAAAVVRRV